MTAAAAEVAELLRWISPDCERDQWVRILMAIKCALGLLLGGKVAVSLVRGERALVEGRWRLPGAAVASRRVVEIGGDLDDGDLMITRSVPR